MIHLQIFHGPLSFIHYFSLFFLLLWLNNCEWLVFAFVFLSSAWSSMILKSSNAFFLFNFTFNCMISVCYFLIFFSLLKFSRRSCVLLTLMSIFTLVILNSLTGKSYISISLGKEVYLVPLLGTCFSVSSFSLILCFGACTLNITATSPSLYYWPHIGQDPYQ